MKLYLTNFNADQTVRATRGVRNAMRTLLADPNADVLVSARSVVEEFQGRPVLLGENESVAIVEAARKALAEDGCQSDIDLSQDEIEELAKSGAPAFEPPPDETPDNEVPDTPPYDACRAAVVVMAHSGGVPNQAISLMNGMLHVLPAGHPARPIAEATRRVLFDSFPMH